VRTAILGFGLIGGSIARALAAAPDAAAWSITGWSPTGDGPRRAESDGTIAAAASAMEDAIDGAELIVLAAPPRACLELIDGVAPLVAARTEAGPIVTDVASTKGALLERARAAGLRYVGGHPMAGKETSGYTAADATLFRDRPWVVVPSDHDDEAAILAVRTLAVSCGARPVTMDARAHDAAVAAISHLPLVLSAALVEAVVGGAVGVADDWPAARTLAASGWRDMTRLARGDVTMGADIATTNAEALSERVRAVRDVLDGWLRDLDGEDGPDKGRVAARLRLARTRLEEAG
jgi:prephenate dehydrogenase